MTNWNIVPHLYGNKMKIYDPCEKERVYFTGLTYEVINKCDEFDFYEGVHAWKNGEEIPFTISPDPQDFDTCIVGEYTYTYTADGYSEERYITVTSNEILTILFGDGTFIINELPGNRENDIELHGDILTSYTAINEDGTNYVFADETECPWFREALNVTAIEVGSTIHPVDMSYWFYRMENAITADVHNIDTTNTEYMISAFSNCSSLTDLDFSMFNTENLIDPKDMLYGCNDLTTLDISNWTFNDNTALAWRDEYSGANFHIPNIISIGLTDVDTSNVTSFTKMFGNMEHLESLDLSSFDTSNATNMTGMFSQCRSLTILDVSMFNTSNVINMDNMFMESGITELDLSNFDTHNVVDMAFMFGDCDIQTITFGNGWNTSNVVNMRNMFEYDYGLTELNICTFSTESLTHVGAMFAHCRNLVTIYVTDFDTTHIMYRDQVFSYCTSIVGGNGTTYNSSNVDGTYGRIDTSVNPGYFTSCV